MGRSILMLRVSYVVGAVIDALAAIALLFPAIQGVMYNIPDFKVTPVINNFSYTGASLMLGWTVLLIWAGRKPLERKGILLITVFPVVAGIACSGIYLVSAGIVPLISVIPTLIMQVCIAGLFLFSYIIASLQETTAGPVA